MWFYQKNPDSFSSESWACQGCGHYTSWKILDDDFRKLPDDKYPESWEYLKQKKQIEGKEFVLADVQRIQDECTANCLRVIESHLIYVFLQCR